MTDMTEKAPPGNNNPDAFAAWIARRYRLPPALAAVVAALIQVAPR